MQNFDVAIIGLGPVGGVAAILLAHQGLSVAVVEKEIDIHPLPRAVSMDGEVVRAFQAIGKGEELDALRQPIRPGERVGFQNSKREWIFSQEMETFSAVGWGPLRMFDQPEFDTYLRQVAGAHPNIHVLLGFKAASITQDANQVAIHAQSADGDDLSLSAKYLIGCDGASSTVRRHIGAEWRDLGYNQDWLVVDVIAKNNADLPIETAQICDPARLTTYLCGKGSYRRWEFKLNDGETREEMLRETSILSLIDPWTPRGTYEIRRTAVYQFHAVNAARWRDRRILIAGDAAHQTPPFLGQGMNAGIRDAINLAWKLPLVIRGDVNEKLLDTYPLERAAHAEDLVDWAVSIGKLMEFFTASEAASRSGAPAPEKTPEKSAGYGQGRTIPPLREGLLLSDQVSNAGTTGYQIAQPIVKDRAGQEFRLDEALGAGFAIVARNAEEIGLSADSTINVGPISLKIVDLSVYSLVRGEFDHVFETEAAVIVRPDRFIFGHTTEELSLDALIEELTQQLQIRV
ncbi:MAG: bifunctional 3-(3-hydroxy-phenyl)propionate/3-hydroxycinnamic acid hydroxylase [Pseudomonadota bacterium]